MFEPHHHSGDVLLRVNHKQEAVHRATASAKSPGCLLCLSLPLFWWSMMQKHVKSTNDAIYMHVYIDGPCGPIVPGQHQ